VQPALAKKIATRRAAGLCLPPCSGVHFRRESGGDNGASAFPQNGGYNPTGTVGALTFHALEAIKSKYLKQPGPLA
jgi:hypothetical protein